MQCTPPLLRTLSARMQQHTNKFGLNQQASHKQIEADIHHRARVAVEAPHTIVGTDSGQNTFINHLHSFTMGKDLADREK